MAGTPDSTVILHWDKCEAVWAELSWRDWVRFRGFDESGFRLLVGAEAGEHYFLVCVLGDRGELCNVIPHRYVISTDGRLAHGFDGLGVAEREESCKIEELPFAVDRGYGASTLAFGRRKRTSDKPALSRLNKVRRLRKWLNNCANG